MELPVCSTFSNSYFPSCDYSTLNYECKVCSNTGHGIHYGVITCRSCASFFRRAFVSNKNLRCIQKNGQCGYDFEKSRCRFCRFKKCLDVGMMTEKVHIDEVCVGSPSSPVNNLELEQQDQRGVDYRVMDWKTQKTSLLIDVNAIIAESRAILGQTYFETDQEIETLNTLERMVYSLRKIRKNQKKPENLQFIKTTKFARIFNMWHLKMKDTSEWLMYSNEFRQLPVHERIEFFKTVWGLWRRFERYTMSAQLFGERCYKEKVYVHSNGYASFSEELQVDQSKFMNQNDEHVLKYFLDDWFETVVKPCVEYKFSTTEIAYMLCQIVWGYAGRRLQGQTLAASERFLEQIGNNLHQYYQKLPNMGDQYSGRIVKMMRVVNDVLNIQLRFEKLMDIAFLFGYFKIIFTDPNFFRV